MVRQPGRFTLRDLVQNRETRIAQRRDDAIRQRIALTEARDSDRMAQRQSLAIVQFALETQQGSVEDARVLIEDAGLDEAIFDLCIEELDRIS